MRRYPWKSKLRAWCGGRPTGHSQQSIPFDWGGHELVHTSGRLGLGIRKRGLRKGSFFQKNLTYLLMSTATVELWRSRWYHVCRMEFVAQWEGRNDHVHTCRRVLGMWRGRGKIGTVFTKWKVMLVVLSAWELCAALGQSEEQPPWQQTAEKLRYTSTWIGSTWPGGPLWVQTSISGLAVLPDGTSVTCSPWDEAHRENTIYGHDGNIIAGVGGSESRTIAADSRYVYTRVNRTVNGKPMQGVARYFRDQFFEKEGPRGLYLMRWCRPAPFTGGGGPDGNERYLVESVPYLSGAKRIAEIAAHPEAAEKYRHARPQITGMASDGALLVVAEDITHHIHMIDCDTMQCVRDIPFRYPGPVALVPGGGLWVVQRPQQPVEVPVWLPWSEVGEYVLVELDRLGRPTGRQIRDVKLPTAIAVSPDGHRLLVADSHPERLQILIYDITSPVPKLIRQFGQPGGVYAGPVPGRRGPDRLNYLSGVGEDKHGCLFVTSRAPSGSWIRRYQSDGTLAWERYTATFMNGAAAVPNTDGTRVLIGRGGSNLLSTDYERASGPLDEWIAVTWDPYRYPHDVRKHGFRLYKLPNDRIYVVINDIESGTLVLREEPGSHILVPSLYMNGGQYHGNPDRLYPPDHPGKHRFMWRDVNGNGQIEKDEYVFVGPHHNARKWAFDSKGDLWEYHAQSNQKGLVRHKLQGFDPHGNPVYDFTLYREVGRDPRGRPRYEVDTERVELFPIPPALDELREWIYDADRDVMFLFGFPPELPSECRNVWSVGSVALRVENFTTRPQVTSQIALPYGKPEEQGRKPDAGNVIRSVAVADDLLFAAITRTTAQGQVWVWNTRSARFLGVLKPGPTLWGETSLVDIPEAVNAFRRGNGEYVVFVENNWKNLQIVYRVQVPTTSHGD